MATLISFSSRATKTSQRTEDRRTHYNVPSTNSAELAYLVIPKCLGPIQVRVCENLANSAPASSSRLAEVTKHGSILLGKSVTISFMKVLERYERVAQVN